MRTKQNDKKIYEKITIYRVELEPWIIPIQNETKKKVKEKKTSSNLKCHSFDIVSLETGHPNAIIFSHFFHSISILGTILYIMISPENI